ncbi:MAG: hypothetical protein ACYSRQ_06660, partial [Planctomycetota bacterium]
MEQIDNKDTEYKYVPVKDESFVKRLFRRYKQLIFVLGILALGICAIYFLIKFKSTAETVEIKTLAPLVKVQQVNLEDVEMIVKQPGTVTPKVEVE